MTRTTIPPDEVAFHPHSFGDRDGRLFRWDGGLYRGLGGERAAFFRDLLESGVVERLADEGLLVETESTPLRLDGYTLVVRHRDVPFPSYPIEWSPTMFRDAALVYVRLLERLLPLGLTLKDVHPWNLLFDFSRPVYVDLTSITSLDLGLPAPEKIARYYLRPLLLMQRGGERIARCLLLDYEAVQAQDLTLLEVNADALPPRLGRRGRVRSRLGSLRRSGHDPSLPSEWRRILEGVSLPDDARGSRPRGEPRSDALGGIVERLRPESILLLGDGGRSFASLAASAGSAVVVLDADSRAVTTLYRHARETRDRILPLTVDFSRPTPSIGFASHYSIAASDRLRCELLVAPEGAIRELVERRSIRPDQLTEGFAAFTRHRLVVEADRSSEALAAALADRFRLLERVDAGGGKSVLVFVKQAG
jgi:hypothetical protein